MGVLQNVAGPLSPWFASLGTASQIVVGTGLLLALVVFVNVVKQVLFKNPNEPPLVFHWFPVIGSTITYGMDPPTFFKVNREKVRSTAGAIA
jgi:sterol 14-demethylase